MYVILQLRGDSKGHTRIDPKEIVIWIYNFFENNL